ncbi:S8 family serine peptidase [Lachnotalea glycerini]|uniref:Peptidase S8/S53 domain-containing protein n=1 Tax=Lachnotalea glycerini TaxID=1763509 RepID=A0A371J961_9FIRM|nr:S8 family serine peptidase [Lachnotalea glycerini]RDY29312.1 hypothetical protein CG710_018480 [Lachnotalea glycerini]
MEQNIIKIAVIDSGVDLGLEYFVHKKIYALEVTEQDGEYKVVNSWTDDNGHGTEIIHIITGVIGASCEYEIYSIKVLNHDLKCSIGKLCYALGYIAENLEVDIINLSLGFYTYYMELHDIICSLKSQVKAIVSAFDNNEKMTSYPAAFPEVFGISGTKTIELDKFIYEKDSNIIQVSDTPLCVISKGGKRKSVYGNSYSCALFTGILAKELSKNRFTLEVDTIIHNVAVKKESLRRRLPGNHKANERALIFPMETTTEEELIRLSYYCEIIAVVSFKKYLIPSIDLPFKEGIKVIPVYDDMQKACYLKPDCIYIGSLAFLGKEKEKFFYHEIFDATAMHGIAVSCMEKPIEISLDEYSIGRGKEIPWYEYMSVLL